MKLDLKSFESLEKKIQKAIELVARLKEENKSLRAQVDALESQVASKGANAKELETLRLTHEQLEKELAVLQNERRTVLARVDGMLETLDRIPLD